MKVKLHFLLVFLWSIAASATVTIFAAIPLFYSLIKPLNLTELSYLSQTTISYNFNTLMAYLLNPFNRALSMPDFKSSSEGLSHFADVKNLFILAMIATIILAIPTLLFIKNRQYIQVYQELKLCLMLPLFVAVISLFGGFDTIFITFHKLLFRNANWLFDPATDPVINILPESYFMACFILFGLIYLLFWSMLLVKAKRRIYHAKN